MSLNKTFFSKNNSTDATAFEPSPAIWGDCPVAEIIADPSRGRYFYDDFSHLPLTPTLTTQIAYGQYKAFASASSTINRSAGGSINSTVVPGNALTFTLEATQTKAATLSDAYSTWSMSSTAGTCGKLWFEACIAVSTIAASVDGFFLGLAEVDASSYTLAVGLPFTDSTAAAYTTTGGHVGFNKIGTSTTAVKTGYTDRGAALTQIGTNQVTLSSTTYTFTKLGMVFDPLKGGAQTMLTYYQDNQILASGVSGTVWTALTNINANNLGLIFSNMTAAGTAFSNYLRWWRVAQLNVGGSGQ